MSTHSMPPELLSETVMMDEKLKELGRDMATAMVPPFATDADAVKRNIATSAAMAALGAGMAGHAFGVWLSAVSSSLEVAQRFTAMATGTAARGATQTVEAPAEAAGIAVAEAVAVARTPAAPKAVARPQAPDDLKAIGGIGPKLEKVLNGFGIWTYAQVANLTEGEILWLDEQLGFRGRIERDEWLGQAAAFLNGKRDGKGDLGETA